MLCFVPQNDSKRKMMILSFNRRVAIHFGFTLLLAFGCTSIATAAVVVSVQGSPLANNSTGQTLELYLASSNGADITDVEGISLATSIGNGLDSQAGVPIFESFSFNLAIAAAFDFAVPQAPQTPEPGNNFRSFEALADFNLPLDTSSFVIGVTPTLIGTYSLNTSGITDEAFDFNVTSFGGSNSFYSSAADGGDVAINQTVRFDVGVVAVPEPSSLAFCSLLVGGLVMRRRRRS
jgi:hypothetical protein